MRTPRIDTPHSADEEVKFNSIVEGFKALRDALLKIAEIIASYEKDRSDVETRAAEALVEKSRKAIEKSMMLGYSADLMLDVLTRFGNPEEARDVLPSSPHQTGTPESTAGNITLGMLHENKEQEQAATEDKIKKIIEKFDELVNSIELTDEVIEDLEHVRRFLGYILGISQDCPGPRAKKIFEYLDHESGGPDTIKDDLNLLLMGIDLKFEIKC
jgi:hypothetical protein